MKREGKAVDHEDAAWASALTRGASGVHTPDSNRRNALWEADEQLFAFEIAS